MRPPVVCLFLALIWTESSGLVVTMTRGGEECTSPSRRNALAKMIQIPCSVVAATTVLPQNSLARNLPLSTGAASDKVGSVEALTPIVQLRQALNGPVSNLPYAIPRDEQGFKRLFDAYSDPVSYRQKFLDQNAFLVYYTKGFDGPNRPSIEDGLPEKQTLQFGARNEAWVAWEELQVELDYSKKYPDDANDVEKLLTKMIAAVDAYLELAPPDDVQEAMRTVRK